MELKIKKYSSYLSTLDLTERQLSSACIRVGTVTKSNIVNNTFDVELDNGLIGTNVPVIIHTDKGCRARKINNDPSINALDYFEDAASCIPMKHMTIFHVWNTTEHHFDLIDFYAPEPKASFLVIENDDGIDEIIACVQILTYLSQPDDTFGNPTHWYAAPPTIDRYILVELYLNNSEIVGHWITLLFDLKTKELAKIPNEDYTSLVDGRVDGKVDELEYFLKYARQIDGIMQLDSSRSGSITLETTIKQNGTNDWWYSGQGAVTLTAGGTQICSETSFTWIPVNADDQSPICAYVGSFESAHESSQENLNATGETSWEIIRGCAQGGSIHDQTSIIQATGEIVWSWPNGSMDQMHSSCSGEGQGSYSGTSTVVMSILGNQYSQTTSWSPGNNTEHFYNHFSVPLFINLSGCLADDISNGQGSIITFTSSYMKEVAGVWDATERTFHTCINNHGNIFLDNLSAIISVEGQLHVDQLSDSFTGSEGFQILNISLVFVPYNVRRYALDMQI